MLKQPTIKRTVRIVGAGAATLLFLMTTTPDTVPAVFLLVPFVGGFAFLYLLILEVVRLLGPDEDENGAIIRVRRPRILSAMLAGFPVLLLLLQSVVELTGWDVLIATMIVLVAYVYIVRGSIVLWKR